MNKLLKTRFLLIAAAAAVPLIGLASGAAAQYRVGTDARCE